MISYTTYHLICFKTFAYIFKRFYLPSHVIQFIIKTEVELLLIKRPPYINMVTFPLCFVIIKVILLLHLSNYIPFKEIIRFSRPFYSKYKEIQRIQLLHFFKVVNPLVTFTFLHFLFHINHKRSMLVFVDSSFLILYS